VGQVFPGAGDSGYLGLATELAFRANLAGHARDFRGEGRELIHHRIDRVFELQDLAADISSDELGEVTGRDRGGDLDDVAKLRGQVGGHEVDAVGQVLPGAGDPAHVGLTAELPFRADLARHARDFRSEGAKLIDHRVDGVFELQDLAADI